MNSNPPTRRNIELKARIGSLAAARAAAERIATSRLDSERQVDTYFGCPHGRLKLRQRDGLPAQLIWYLRPDDRQPRPSDYHLVQVDQPEPLKQALAAGLGIRVVTEKRREIYLHHHVRIHLDQVTGLGEFLEFEAVLDQGADEIESRALISTLARHFALDPSELVDCSYSDLLIVERPPAS
ncbi:MAG: class IV adenylate cyclase [Pirellulales bacterium]